MSGARWTNRRYINTRFMVAGISVTPGATPVSYLKYKEGGERRKNKP